MGQVTYENGQRREVIEEDPPIAVEDSAGNTDENPKVNPDAGQAGDEE